MSNTLFCIGTGSAAAAAHKRPRRFGNRRRFAAAIEKICTGFVAAIEKFAPRLGPHSTPDAGPVLKGRSDGAVAVMLSVSRRNWRRHFNLHSGRQALEALRHRLALEAQLSGVGGALKDTARTVCALSTGRLDAIGSGPDDLHHLSDSTATATAELLHLQELSRQRVRNAERLVREG